MAALLLLPAAAPSVAQEPTRGVGVYPGDPAESFAPRLVPDPTTYRNLALHRPAYHSTQLRLQPDRAARDRRDPGLRTPPRWLSTSTTSGGGLRPKSDREFPVDHSAISTVEFEGPGWVQFELGGGDAPLEIDRILAEVRPRRPAPWQRAQPKEPVKDPGAETKEWVWTVSASDDGKSWTELGRATGKLEPPPPLPSGGDSLRDVRLVPSRESRF